MKKTLALVLAFALVFSTITVAFADTTTATISADAKACADLGMLVGDGNGVTADYTATTPSRLQAATMALRLKGLEAEAKAFTGTDNFADVDKVNYADGKAILAYLKAHKELGWIGDGTNFDPTSKVTAQQYYKTLLESLGYKQTTADVAGDFTYAETIAFAATKGLTKAATAANFTIADLATATVEGLKATVKGGTKTLATTLVEAKALDQTKVDAALNGTTAPVAAAAVLDTVMATANDKVEVGFDIAVDKAFAENVANYKVVVKGSTTALEVKSAVLTSDPKFVMLTTAAQTGGTAYTMTVGTTSVNFAGAAKVTGAPEVDTVTCLDTNTVEVVFTKAVDRATAEDVANYTLDKSATVKSAVLWASQDDTRKTVKLVTEGVANSKVYTLKVQNVKSADLVAIKSVSKSFTGITDTTAPKINGAITVSNNERLLIDFTDGRGLDEASAETLANWSIKDSNGAELKVVSVTAKDDDGDAYGYLERVEVVTAEQTSGTKYTVTISNLADGSVAKNVAATLTKTFSGKADDKTAPTVSTCTAISDTAIKVVFSDINRMDAATLTNISNYTFAKDITVTKAEILRPTKPDLTLGKTVLLTTTAMDEDISTYKLTITGIADEFGNVISTFTKSISYHAEDVTPPYVKTVDWVDMNTVKLTFDDTLDNTSATDAANYSISGGLGTVTKAEISGSNTNLYKVVTLTTPKMAANTKYTVTVTGVKDLVGNATSNAKGYFTSERDGLDTTAPTISTIDVVSKNEVRITFDEKVSFTAGSESNALTVQYGTSWGSTLTFDKVGQILDDGTTIVYKSDDATVSGDNDKTFRISALAAVKDTSNNVFVPDTTDYDTFNGNSAANEAATVDSIEQVDAKTVKIVFDKPVVLTAGADAFDAVAAGDAYVDRAEEDTNDSESTITLKTTAPLTYNTAYEFDLSGSVDDYMGVDVTDLANVTAGKTTLTATIDDDDKPVIEYVEAVTTKKLQVHYNEEMSTAGTYKIYADGATTPLSSTSYVYAASVDGTDATIVNVTLTTGALTANSVYQIKPSSSAKDLSNNSSVTTDVSFSFVGSAVTPYDYIKGVTIVDANTIKVYTTCDLAASSGTVPVITVVNEAGVDIANVVTMPGDSTIDANDDLSVAKITLKQPLTDGEDYDVTVTTVTGVTGVTSIADAFTFTGDVEDGGIAVDSSNIVTFSGIDVDSYVVTVVYTDASLATFTLYSNPTGATVAFDITTNLHAYADSDDTTDGTLAQIKTLVTSATTGQAGYYTINVYRTVGVADGTVSTAAQTWTNYKADINGKIESAPIYTTQVAVTD